MFIGDNFQQNFAITTETKRIFFNLENCLKENKNIINKNQFFFYSSFIRRSDSIIRN